MRGSNHSLDDSNVHWGGCSGPIYRPVRSGCHFGLNYEVRGESTKYRRPQWVQKGQRVSSLGKRRLCCGWAVRTKLSMALLRRILGTGSSADLKYFPTSALRRCTREWGLGQVLHRQSHRRLHALLTIRPARYGYSNMAIHHTLHPPGRHQNSHKHRASISGRYPQTEKSAVYPEQGIRAQKLVLKPRKNHLRRTPPPHTQLPMVVHPTPNPRLAMTKPPATGSIRLRSNFSRR